MPSTIAVQLLPCTQRWVTFYSVGALGMGVQLTTVWALVGLAGLDYLAGTAIGVEVAVLHNFLWHERWTWSDRNAPFSGPVFSRLVRFNVANGLLSLWGNVVLTAVFVATLGMGYLVANGLAIAMCSVLSFLVSDRLVFTAPTARESSTRRASHFLANLKRG